eukprot:g6092.t1
MSQVTLAKLDAAAEELQSRGARMEALECMERGLVLRQHFYGSDSAEVKDACRGLAQLCNQLAMDLLSQDEDAKDVAAELLKKAEVLSEFDDVCKAVTFNNLGCFYRRTGRPQAALSYLLKAQRIEARLPEDQVERPADTFLNLCAVLSQMGRHSAALEHGQSALILLQEELFGDGDPDPAATAGEQQEGTEASVAGSIGAAGLEAAAGAEARAGVQAGAAHGGDGGPDPERLAVLAIAYHNIGVEQEHLGRQEQSLQSYRKGVKLASRHLPSSHPVLASLKRSYFEAHRTIAAEVRRAQASGAVLKAGGTTGLKFDAIEHNIIAASKTPHRRVQDS